MHPSVSLLWGYIIITVSSKAPLCGLPPSAFSLSNRSRLGVSVCLTQILIRLVRIGLALLTLVRVTWKSSGRGRRRVIAGGPPGW